MKVDFETDVGAVRSSNQDACDGGLFSKDSAWAVVCDGMGGANGGNVASAMAVESIRRRLLEGFHQDITREGVRCLLLEAVTEANRAVYRRSQEEQELRGMGTTAVVLVASKGTLHVAHVGDSRAYLKNSQGLSQITMDHSYVQDLVNFGQITKEEARVHPRRNIITRVLGVHPQVECDYDSYDFSPGDTALACTDGLTGYMEDGLLDEYLEHYGQNGSALAKKLIQFAVEKGGSGQYHGGGSPQRLSFRHHRERFGKRLWIDLSASAWTGSTRSTSCWAWAAWPYVYKAYDRVEDRWVAIKILKEELANNSDFLRRFRNEAKAITLLSHPNIVGVYDVSFGDQLQYIVMEYIDGITLKQYIEQEGTIRWQEALHFTTQILLALEHAHSKGIIHRDIKPQNIMLLRDGTIKVADFGIARFLQSETQTMTDKAIGSVHYIAPEQARGDYITDKADIYSVGVMLYEMLTGKLPFDGGQRRVCGADAAAGQARYAPGAEPLHPQGAGADHHEGHGEEPGGPVPVRGGDAGRHRPVPPEPQHRVPVRARHGRWPVRRRPEHGGLRLLPLHPLLPGRLRV